MRALSISVSAQQMDGTLQLLLPLILLLSPASGQTEPAEVGEWLAVVAASTDVSNSTKDALRQTCNLAQAQAWSTPQDRHRLLDALHLSLIHI